MNEAPIDPVVFVILFFSFLVLVGVIVAIVGLKNAPRGYESDDGFHAGSPPAKLEQTDTQRSARLEIRPRAKDGTCQRFGFQRLGRQCGQSGTVKGQD